jgi:transposase
MDDEPAQGCAECERLREVIKRLEARITELESRLDQNSSNSHKPPSSNSPWRVPKKKPTGGKPGGQKGHQGHHRRLLPPERVDHFVHYVPSHCKHCGEALAAQAGLRDPVPHRHQVAELPPITVTVTEHQGHVRTCPACGKRTREPIPAPVLAHVAGPRLSATLSYMSGRCHDGRRTVVEIARDLFGLSLSLGTVVQYESQMSDALAGAAVEALSVMREAKIKNVDETGWKQSAKNCWLWTAATPKVAVFALQKDRNAGALHRLIGKRGGRGVICSDLAACMQNWESDAGSCAGRTSIASFASGPSSQAKRRCWAMTGLGSAARSLACGVTFATANCRGENFNVSLNLGAND